MAGQYVRLPASSTSIAIPAIGSNGAIAPTSSILVAGQDPGNLLIPLSVDVLGKLNVTVAGTPNFNLSAFGGTAVTIGQQLSAASLPVVLPAAQIITLTPPTSVGISGLLPAFALTPSFKLTDGTNTAVVGASGNILISGLAAVGSAPILNPVSVSGVDGGGLKRHFLTDTSGRQEINSIQSLPSLAAGGNAIGSVIVSNFPAIQPVSGTVAISTLPSIPAGGNAIGSVSVSNFPAIQPVSGTVAVSTLPSIPAGGNAIGSVIVSNFPATQPVSIASLPSNLGRSSVNLATNSYSTTNVTTGAYVQLVASTAAASNLCEIFDSSGQTLVLATGAPGSEIDRFYINPGGNGQVPFAIPISTRVSIKAVSATAASGQINLTLFT